jgi:hypothetical protein
MLVLLGIGTSPEGAVRLAAGSRNRAGAGRRTDRTPEVLRSRTLSVDGTRWRHGRRRRDSSKGAGQGSQIGHALVESPTGLIVDEAVKATGPCAKWLKR